MSRLPPLTMESPLVLQGRSDYFRSMSQDSLSESEPAEPGDSSPGVGFKTEIEDAFADDKRPMSMHPRMSRIPPTPNADLPAFPQSIPEMPRGRRAGSNGEATGQYFGARRERSPSPLQSDRQGPARKDSTVSASSKHTTGYASSPEKAKQDSFDELGLVPPPSLFPKRSSSIFSASPVPGDDDSSSSLGGSFHSLPTGKSSDGSAAVGNTMPSPAASSSFKRSPSTASESSALPRPSFNFSRPLSRAGTPGFDMPSRQASSDSQPSFIFADESAQTPVSMHSEAFLDQQVDETKTAAPSYIYSKFSLPRGKTIQRSEPSDNAGQATFQWEQQPVLPPSNVHRFPIGAPPSPPTRPSSSSARTVPDDAMSTVSSVTRPSMDASKASLDSSRLGASLSLSRPSRPSVESSRKSEEAPRGRTLSSAVHDQARGRTPVSAVTSDSASTIRPPPTARSLANSHSEMTAEDHLAKGIECHENGSLNESTYHLRLAARQNNPTAMLLYALACRHGWGMRANQREGVSWLRKAVECASVEIADDEDQVKDGRVVGNVLERRTRKAQFALSIYELGVSHMNGWGIEQDKSLALRCFEIAGSKKHK